MTTRLAPASHGRATDVPGRSSEQGVLLELEQLLLALQPAGVPGEGAVGADDAVARARRSGSGCGRWRARPRGRRRWSCRGDGRPRRRTRSRRRRSSRSWSHTRCWNSVPTGASGRSNSVSSRAKYAVSWRSASASTGLVVRAGAERAPVGGLLERRELDRHDRAVPLDDAQVADRRGHHGPHVSLLLRARGQGCRASGCSTGASARRSARAASARRVGRSTEPPRSASTRRIARSVGRKTSGWPSARIAT